MTKNGGPRHIGLAVWLSLTAALVIFSSAMPVQAALTRGGASWYALAGNRTASGETMNPAALTAAHRTLPFGTRVEVKNLRNGRTVVVRINDRGPFVRGRVIDVSRAAARRLGFVRSGTTRVQLRVVARPTRRTRGKSKQVRQSRRPTATASNWSRWLNNLVR